MRKEFPAKSDPWLGRCLPIPLWISHLATRDLFDVLEAVDWTSACWLDGDKPIQVFLTIGRNHPNYDSIRQQTGFRLPVKIVVLVVEDEAIIRMNAVAIIEDAGYDVFEASNADDAIFLLETRPGIGVVFSDIEMPGSMDGLKLIHAVRERWPPVVLILASGRFSPQAADMPSDTVFRRKPYAEDDLKKALTAGAA